MQAYTTTKDSKRPFLEAAGFGVRAGIVGCIRGNQQLDNTDHKQFAFGCVIINDISKLWIVNISVVISSNTRE
jgi:hypothetical protein